MSTPNSLPALPLSEQGVDAALVEPVCEGENVRFYLEAYAFERDDEETRRIMTREVVSTAIRAYLSATPERAAPEKVRSLMEMATKMMRDSWATGSDASWQPAYQALESALREALASQPPAGDKS